MEQELRRRLLKRKAADHEAKLSARKRRFDPKSDVIRQIEEAGRYVDRVCELSPQQLVQVRQQVERDVQDIEQALSDVEAFMKSLGD